MLRQRTARRLLSTPFSTLPPASLFTGAKAHATQSMFSEQRTHAGFFPHTRTLGCLTVARKRELLRWGSTIAEGTPEVVKRVDLYKTSTHTGIKPFLLSGFHPFSLWQESCSATCFSWEGEASWEDICHRGGTII